MNGTHEIPHSLDLETLTHLLNCLYDEVLVYDNNYNIIFINSACIRHYGVKPSDMIGKTFYDFVNQDWWNNSILPLVYKSKKAYAARQTTYLGAEILTVAVPVFDENHEIEYVVMNVRDEINEKDLYYPRYTSIAQMDEAVFTQPIAYSPEMKKVLSLASRIAPIDVTCILTGESGTGKTMLARYIHSISSRRDKPFLSINCASIPEDLIESELFGYVKGAFTGANTSGKEGLFKAANQGTLFLDEVSELSPAAQAKLLHVLQDGVFTPVGSNKSIKTDVRLLAATNKDFKSLIDSGQFREDLYYRLNVIEIHLPPLRKRKEDIRPLIIHYLDEFCRKYGLNRKLTDASLAALEGYLWPGNIRELSHILERLVVTTDNLLIDVTDLPRLIFGMVDYDDPYNLSSSEKLSFDEKISTYESLLVKEAYEHGPSSRQVAAELGITQTRANKLIQKYCRSSE